MSPIVLVTGGCGFIGSNFLNLSVPRYPHSQFVNVDSLTYAANPKSLSAIDALNNYRFEKVDIADGPAIHAVFERYRPTLVVHFAAESHVDRSILGPAAFVRTNIEGTFQLLEACRKVWKAGEGLFHHVSTDEVYGSLGPTGYFTEQTAYDPSSPYSASKAASDHLVRAYGRTYGLLFKLTNCSNNYGPFQFPEKLIPLMILNAKERKPLPVYGQGLNVRDWLYVEDHCEAIWSVIEKGKPFETYNIGGNNELRNIDLVRQLCRVVASETESEPDELEHLITFVKDRPGHDLRYAIDSSKIRCDCDWQPRETFETGLLKTVRWYTEHPDWVNQVRSGEYQHWIDQNYRTRVQ